MDALVAQLAALGYTPLSGRIEPTETLVARLEDRFALTLPVDYREFLLQRGGYFGGRDGGGVCRFLEPCPWDEVWLIDIFFGFMTSARSWRHDIRARTARLRRPGYVAIGCATYGDVVVLQCRGPGAGRVSLLDLDSLGEETDRVIRHAVGRGPAAERYIALRQAGSLPVKEEADKDLYRLADSFSALVATMEPFARIVQDSQATEENRGGKTSPT